MADEGNGGPERSSIEIRALLHKLDPKAAGGGHKERVRRLARFRNYVTSGMPVGTPEFYDDDLPLLFLGPLAPVATLDEDLVGLQLYGLIQAAGCPSEDHENQLKRSCKNAMSLLKYLVIDHVDYSNGRPTQDKKKDADALNLFANAFCMCSTHQLRNMNLDLHMLGDKRGGDLEDASEIIVLLLTRHLADDGETPDPISLETLLPSAPARKIFDAWLTRHKPTFVQQRVRNANTAAALARPVAVESKSRGQDGDGGRDDRGGDDDSNNDSTDDNYDPLNAFNKQKVRKKSKREVLEEGEKRDQEIGKLGVDLYKLGPNHGGPPVRWEDSDIYRSQIARQNALAKGKALETLREVEDSAAIKIKQEEEKAKLLARDPLGVRSDDFDLRVVQEQRNDLLEQAIRDIEDEIDEAQQTDHGDEKEKQQHLTNLKEQKESLESVVDALNGMSTMETPANATSSQPLHGNKNGSILPTDPNFDPLLFLTLVHRNASFHRLAKSIGRLSNKTDDQAQQLQNLVRDNFELFMRCADDFDIFSDKELGKGRSRDRGLKDRLDTLDAYSEASIEQARKSFKPLLDNTEEVRKVQASLAVLQRVAPILQAPTLMRQHIENGRFSQAVKEYRRVTIIDENCNIDLLNHVKAMAAEAAREARRDLECRLARENSSVNSLLDAIRDLREILELDVPKDPNENKLLVSATQGDAAATTKQLSTRTVGVFDVGGSIINVRDHHPALACLLLQSAHFSALVQSTIDQTETNAQLIFEGESLSKLHGGDTVVERMLSSEVTADSGSQTTASKRTSGNQWKYDVLDARVIATIRAVEVVQRWLPRLLQIGVAAHDGEKRRAARIGRHRKGDGIKEMENGLTAFEVFIANINPVLTLIVEHAAFCALGSSSRSTGSDIQMSFGRGAKEKLRLLLRSPLPPSQSSKCSKELAKLVELIVNCSSTANGLRPDDMNSSNYSRLSPLNECRMLTEEAVVTVERRRCIYAFDVCSRSCFSRAQGNGKFDVEALLNCLQSLLNELSRAEECTDEVEKGCEVVVRRCCDGLASYVRDRGDSARLRAVSECAGALNTIVDIVREVGYLTGGRVDIVEEIMTEDVLGLESVLFDEFVENIRHNISSCTRIGWMETPEGAQEKSDSEMSPTFPPYLSASLLAIVRCRAQVERALGDTVRGSEGITYNLLAMQTAADGVIEGICEEINERKVRMKVRQADRLANELQFLMNTLRNYLSHESLAMVDTSRRMLCSKAGRGAGFRGDGPDGLAALEELERLGRVYVLCLSD